MNSSTKKILGKLISKVAHHNKNLWWELKHESSTLVISRSTTGKTNLLGLQSKNFNA